jgi:hypothetical protein
VGPRTVRVFVNMFASCTANICPYLAIKNWFFFIQSVNLVSLASHSLPIVCLCRWPFETSHGASTVTLTEISSVMRQHSRLPRVFRPETFSMRARKTHYWYCLAIWVIENVTGTVVRCQAKLCRVRERRQRSDEVPSRSFSPYCCRQSMPYIVESVHE